jgi:hypothetical protein
VVNVWIVAWLETCSLKEYKNFCNVGSSMLKCSRTVLQIDAFASSVLLVLSF